MRRIAISIIAAAACAASVSLPARAETINVYDDHGGVVPDYDAHWAELAARGVDVRIVGPCQSACTILLAHSLRPHLRDAAGAVRLPSREVPKIHRHDVGGLQRRHSRLDQRARRADAGLQMDGRARHVSVLPEVLNCAAASLLPASGEKVRMRGEEIGCA